MKNFLDNLGRRLATLMQGRYGNDQFNHALCVAAIVLILPDFFLGTGVFIFLSWALLVYSLFRSFSRNYAKRSAENQKYLKFIQGPKRRVRNAKTKWVNRKTTAYFKCKACKAELSVPKGKGKLRVVCPKCKTEQYRRS